MNISKSLKDYLNLALAGILLVSSNFIGRKIEKPYIFISKQEKSLNLNNNFLNQFNLGLKSFISSSLWVATIIESDHEHYKNKDLNSWMFLRFNTISILDPNFYENYAFGGPYLSIIKDDLDGASIIYDKGLKQFPDDFSLLRDSGFHYYFEVGNSQKAALSYDKLLRSPLASPSMMTTFARLKVGEGKLEDAFNLLSEQYKKIQDKESFIANKISSYLYSIKAQIDLECLNNSLNIESCSKKDLKGNDYIIKDKKYIAKENWIPFTRGQKKKELSDFL